MSFSKRLRELRENKGLSQEAFADKLDIPRSSITHYENSEDRLPRRERLSKISKFFNVSIDYLIGDIDNPVSDNPNKKEEPFSIAFRGGLENISEEEAEYLEQQLNQFRELRKKFQHEDK